MITDFHSHIMPYLDDGAADEATALAMLKRSREQGVDTVVSTSHCYPLSGHDIDKFIDQRQRAYEKLMSAAGGQELPQIKLGSEVHLTCDLVRLRGIERLCVEGTNHILVEMPARKWTDDLIDYVYKLSISGFKPVIAHAERNLGQSKEMLNNLYMLDVLIQINAESFGIAALRKFIDVMMKQRLIHIVGTDMHNLTTRMPNMDKAQRAIVKRFGTGCWEYVMDNARTILGGGELSYRDMKSFSKKSLFFKKNK